MKRVKLDERVLIPQEYYDYIHNMEKINFPFLFSNFSLRFVGESLVISKDSGWRLVIENRSIQRYLEGAIEG